MSSTPRARRSGGSRPRSPTRCAASTSPSTRRTATPATSCRVNAEKIVVTGNKLRDKRYWRHSGYPGGIRSRTLGEHARAPPRGGHPQGRARDAAAQPTRPQAAHQAQDLRRAGPPPRRPAADARWRWPPDGRRRAHRQRPPEEQTPRSRKSQASEEPTPEAAVSRASRRPRRRHPRGRRSRVEPAEEQTESPASEASEEAPAAEQPAEGDDEEKPKAKDQPPGAELEPIAIESERELSAEERAKREAEAEERAKREAEATAEETDEEAPRQAAVKLEGDARVIATGKRKTSIARVILLPGRAT